MKKVISTDILLYPELKPDFQQNIAQYVKTIKMKNFYFFSSFISLIIIISYKFKPREILKSEDIKSSRFLEHSEIVYFVCQRERIERKF